MKSIVYLLAVLLTVSVLGCKKEQRGLADPPELLLLPQHDGHRLSDGVLDNVTLYYLEVPNREVAVPDFGRADGTGYQRGILSSSDVAALSADALVKVFYLRFPDGSQDTLYIDYQSISDEDARENKCYCNKPLVNFTVNGQVPPMAPAGDDGTPVYFIYK